MKGKIMRLKLLCGLSALIFGVSLTAQAQEKTAQEALREQYSKNREQIEMIFKRKIEKISQSKALPEKMRNLLVRQADEMREFDIYTQDRKLEMKMRQMSERDKIKNELKQELYQKEAQLEEQKQADAAQEAALTPLEKSVAPTEKTDEKAAAAPVEEKADEKAAAVVIEQVKTTVVEPVEAVAAPATPVEEKADEKVAVPVAPAASVDAPAPLSEKAASVMKQMKEQAASAPADEAVSAPATPVVIEEVKTVVVPVVETAAPVEEKAIEKTLAPVAASAPAVEEKTDEKVDAVPAALDAVPAAPLDDGVKELGGGLEREL